MFTTFLSWSNQIFFGKFINKNEEYKPEQSPYQLKLSNTFISGSGLFISYASGRRKKKTPKTEEPKQTRGVNLSRIFFPSIARRFLSYLGNLALAQRRKARLKQTPALLSAGCVGTEGHCSLMSEI